MAIKELFFYAETQAQGVALAARLQQDKLLVPNGAEGPERFEGARDWIVVAYAPYSGYDSSAWPEELEKLDSYCRAAARAHQCEFDGWGETIGNLSDLMPGGDV